MSRLVLLVGAPLAVAVAALTLPVRTDSIWIDLVTGSVKSQTRWLFFGATPTVRRSAIEQWVIKHEGACNPRWHFVSEHDQTVFGRTVARGCALAPVIFPLRLGDLNTGFVRAASDSEIAEFLRIMREGSASEKEQAVDAACRKATENRG